MLVFIVPFTASMCTGSALLLTYVKTDFRRAREGGTARTTTLGDGYRGPTSTGDAQRFPCAPVSEGLGSIKTGWAGYGSRAGSMDTSSGLLERDAGSVVYYYFFPY